LQPISQFRSTGTVSPAKPTTAPQRTLSSLSWPAPTGPSQRAPSYWGWLIFFIAAVLCLAALSIRLAGLYQTSKTQDSIERETRAASERLRTYFTDISSSFSQQAEKSAPLLSAEAFSKEKSLEVGNILKQQWSQSFVSLPALLRIELRDAQLNLLASLDSPPPNPRVPRDQTDRLLIDTRVAVEHVRDRKEASYSRSFYLTFGNAYGGEVIDLVVAANPKGTAFYVFTLLLSRALDNALPPGFLSTYGIALADVDGTMIARPTGLLFRQADISADVPVRVGEQGLILRASRPANVSEGVASTQLSLLLMLCSVLLASGVMLWRTLRQRRSVEQNLIAETTLRRAMEDSLVTGLRARDMEGRILYINRAFTEMTGFAPEELIGIKPPMPYWAPEGAVGYQKRYAQVLSGSVGREAFETVFMRKNGERFPALIHESPLVDALGKQTGWMSSVIDVSELKRAEDLNRRQQEQLQTNARLAMLGEVATVLSHEINQPLSAIQSYATASQNLLEAGHPGEAEQALRKLVQQADRAAQVVRSVGDFVKRRKLNFEDINIAETIEELRPILQLQTKRQDVQLVCTLESNLYIRGDRTMFEQALLNLTRNAVESMEKTPHEARILEVQARCERDSAGRPSKANILVIDRGQGVPPENASKLFNPFFTTKSDGIGVGLSLSRTIAEAFGGSLSYHPNQTSGSVFTLILPLSGTTEHHEHLPG
jgi:two-component system, LuxR family, sensor histidine kinase DctS